MVVNKRNLPPHENPQTGNKRKINAKVRRICVLKHNKTESSVYGSQKIYREGHFSFLLPKMSSLT